MCVGEGERKVILVIAWRGRIAEVRGRVGTERGPAAVPSNGEAACPLRPRNSGAQRQNQTIPEFSA